jgi:hypothetical protein
LTRLGYTDTCSRCGGSGHYSYNVIDGTVCFGCRGSGSKLPRITKTVAREAKRRIDAGELDAWFAECRSKAEARRSIAPVKAQINHDWKYGAIHTAYRAMRGVDSSVVVRSPAFRAATLANSIWDASNQVERDVKRGSIGAIQALESMCELSDMLSAVNDAFSAYDCD